MVGDLIPRHVRIVQPTTEPHPFGAAIRRGAQGNGNAFNGALQ
jgi:hypothetical protein